MKQKKNNTPPSVNTDKATTKKQTKAVVEANRFSKFIRTQENRKFFWSAVGISILYFIVLRLLYPVPLYYPDSNTYIQVARDNQDISFRPVQYSQVIRFFKEFSNSDFALIAGQYFSSVFANLFLFFTCTYFFNFRKANKYALFILLLVNPLYLLCSNFILSDSLFSSLSVVWFTLLIWILKRPTWYYTAIQLLLLLVLFKLRYNAIIFPFFTLIAVLLTKQQIWQKAVTVFANFAIIGVLIFGLMNTTEEVTGTRTFSAFGGWQIANNAMFLLHSDRNIDTTHIDDADVKDVYRFVKHNMDTSKAEYDTANLTGVYMWDKGSPLKKYVNVYAQKNFSTGYFEAWTALGPIYSKFGQAVIFQKPGAYFNRFIKPNSADYFLPSFEAYEEYSAKPDTVQRIVQEYYGYSTNRSGRNHPWVYTYLIYPWKYIFMILNIAFLAIVIVYLISKKFKTQPALFNKALICYGFFFVGNFFFVVLLAPTTFRYHIFIITLTLPFLLWIFQQLIKPVKTLE
ncbi:hypothetical protein [Ferruginibacter albus]|uniref:hypothetical protein n=1 Tax=Ferruginibacter albus TaxID=2875540 RepID=UPI001CC3B49D|nr:hypothetical protein [Ferruginibacter albus]UAY52597.1 hypothetical protein K9M53_02640 [Ferruginibacter albus]